MPYEIVRRKGKYVVKKKNSPKTFGSHKTKGKAKAQLRAIKANEKDVVPLKNL